MKETVIRIYVRENGKISDAQQDYELSDFGGFLPAIGDTILDPGVLQGLDRHKAENRTVWKVIDRVFNPRDLSEYVCLVVDERPGTEADTWL